MFDGGIIMFSLLKQKLLTDKFSFKKESWQKAIYFTRVWRLFPVLPRDTNMLIL